MSLCAVGLGFNYRRAGPPSHWLVSLQRVAGRAGSKAELTFLEGVGIPRERSLSPACSQLTISSPLRPPGLFIASHPKHKLLFAAFPRPRPRLCFKSESICAKPGGSRDGFQMGTQEPGLDGPPRNLRTGEPDLGLTFPTHTGPRGTAPGAYVGPGCSAGPIPLAGGPHRAGTMGRLPAPTRTGLF